MLFTIADSRAKAEKKDDVPLFPQKKGDLAVSVDLNKPAEDPGLFPGGKYTIE